jgi:RNA polymerase sigma-70 factor (ECF subfamily)
MASEQTSPAAAAADPNAGGTDEALMAAFAGGDARAFEQLVGRHQRGVFNFLLRSVGNRAKAEELLQEVFLRVVRSKARYQASAKFTTWLYSIARNLSIDASRRARFRDHTSLDAPRRGSDGNSAPMVAQLPAQTVPTDEAAEAPTIRKRLAEAVQALPDEQREVFLLRQLSGLSFREIADTVGIPENTVKSRMRYALEKLRGELGDLRATEPKSAGRRHV